MKVKTLAKCLAQQEAENMWEITWQAQLIRRVQGVTSPREITQTALRQWALEITDQLFADLARWVAGCEGAVAFCDDALQELDFNSFFQLLAFAQSEQIQDYWYKTLEECGLKVWST